MNLGLFFGTFDPVHNGHISLANYFLDFTYIDKIIFIVTPESPFKTKKKISNKNYRFDMLKLSLENINNLEVSDIEFEMAKPNYTYLTLKKLSNKYPYDDFIIIIGEDNLEKLDTWKNYDEIIKNNKIFVYPRNNNAINYSKYNHDNISFFNKAPIFNISSTLLREMITQKKDVSFFLNEKVFNYIKEQNLYI